MSRALIVVFLKLGLASVIAGVACDQSGRSTGALGQAGNGGQVIVFETGGRVGSAGRPGNSGGAGGMGGIIESGGAVGSAGRPGNSGGAGVMGGANGAVCQGGSATTTTSHCASTDLSDGDVSCNTIRCAGIVHRVATNVCPRLPPDDTQLQPTGQDACRRDTDCTARPYGDCVYPDGNGGRSGNLCVYGCVVDGDCGTGSACDCRAGGRGTCTQANCTTDADCAPSRLCAKVKGGCAGTGEGYAWLYACQTANDDCATDSDCGGTPFMQCRWDGNRFACLTSCPIP